MKKIIFLLLLISVCSFGQVLKSEMPFYLGANTDENFITTPGESFLTLDYDFKNLCCDISLDVYTTVTDPVLKQPAGQMWYYEYTNLSPNKPILIFLHGAGERSDVPNLAKIQANGLPKLLKAAGLSYLDGFTVICPQQTTNTWSWERNPNDPDIIKFIKYIRANYQFDGRLYVTGLSMGGRGAWDASYSLLNDSNLITAIVPVSTNGDYKGAVRTAQRKIPTWDIYGDADTAFPKNEFESPINGMRDGGFPASVNIIKGGTHSSSTWDVAYSLTPRVELGNTTIYEWMLKQGVPLPIEPPVPDPQDDVIRTYYQGGKIHFVTKSGLDIVN